MARIGLVGVIAGALCVNGAGAQERTERQGDEAVRGDANMPARAGLPHVCSVPNGSRLVSPTSLELVWVQHGEAEYTLVVVAHSKQGGQLATRIEQLMGRTW